MLHESSKRKSAKGNFKIGNFYENGIGAEQNLNLEIKYYNKAASMDHEKVI